MQKGTGSKLLLAATALILGLAVPVVAQNSPASTYQPGYWQPLARVNPSSPFTVTLLNQTGKPLEYNYLDGRGENNLAVGASAQLKNISLPANIAVYDPSPKAADTGSHLDYQVSVTNNAVNVSIVPVAGDGFHVVNINKTGAIYRY